MSGAALKAAAEPALSDNARDALLDELFRRWEAAEPGSHKCFTGSDADLLATVARYRDQQDRERG